MHYVDERNDARVRYVLARYVIAAHYVKLRNVMASTRVLDKCSVLMVWEMARRCIDKRWRAVLAHYLRNSS